MSLPSIQFAQGEVSSSPAGIAILVLVILDVAVIVSVLAGKGTLGHKVLWSLLVLLLPFLGVLLYFVIGRSRVDRALME
jgi:hypothetical protein